MINPRQKLFSYINAQESSNIPADTEKSDPSKSVTERKVNGRLKCFKCCSVSERVAYNMISIRNFFGIVNFSN